MDVKIRLTQLLEDHGVSLDSIEIDSEILAFLENLLSVCDFEDVDQIDLVTTCEAYIPQLGFVPRGNFLKWFEMLYKEFHSESNSVAPQSHLSEDEAKFGGTLDQKLTEVTTEDKICLVCGSKCSETVNDASLTDLINLFPNVCRTRLKEFHTSTNEDINQTALLCLNYLNSLRVTHNAKTESNKDSKDEFQVEKLTSDERLAFMERYGFIKDTSGASACAHVVHSIPNKEKKSNVRYLDGKPVDTKGKKYVEINPVYPNLAPATFLKAFKRYKFH